MTNEVLKFILKDENGVKNNQLSLFNREKQPTFKKRIAASKKRFKSTNQVVIAQYYFFSKILEVAYSVIL
ncbi:MAG: hypothetical protein ACJA2S_000240 [Cyclobacteriaceae bacterium]|jgi:hypothetical protein